MSLPSPFQYMEELGLRMWIAEALGFEAGAPDECFYREELVAIATKVNELLNKPQPPRPGLIPRGIQPDLHTGIAAYGGPPNMDVSDLLQP